MGVFINSLDLRYFPSNLLASRHLHSRPIVSSKVPLFLLTFRYFNFQSNRFISQHLASFPSTSLDLPSFLVKFPHVLSSLLTFHRPRSYILGLPMTLLLVSTYIPCALYTISIFTKPTCFFALKKT